jgi:glucose/arabinose dehydrogenase
MTRRHRPRRAVLVATAALTATAALAVPAPTPASAASVPPGFTSEAVASFGSLTTVEWLPGDRLVVLQKGGELRVSQAGGPWTTALDLSVCTQSERGLLGIAADPAFLVNGFVYLYYTRPAGGTCVNRVSRFTMSGTTISPSTEFVLLDNIASTGGNHNGGGMEIGGDGLLYIGIGDAGSDPRGNSGSGGGNDAAQDLSLLNGKIVRITLTGDPAPGNPFGGAGTGPCRFAGTSAPPSIRCQEIYAWGLRNPYRIAFDRNRDDDRFFINDVGQNTREEVNLGIRGADYGWPDREGQCPQGQNPPCPGPPAGVTDPLTDYPRSQGTFITAGAVVPDGVWPAQYDGAYLFADGGSGRIWLRATNGSVDYGAPFATDAFGVTDMAFGFDATGRAVLYYVTSNGAVRAIRSTTAPATPAAGQLAFIPNATPIRVYDTEAGVGVTPGRMYNGTTRLIDLQVPGGAAGALVNVTIADSAGGGFLRTWIPRGLRPGTSTVNADQAGGFVANAAIVAVDADGQIVLEAATTARVVVDVMGHFVPAATAVDDGRFVALDPERVLDTREPASDPSDPDGRNVFERSGDTITFAPFGTVGAPVGEPADAVVLSVGAIADPAAGGFVGAYNPGVGYEGTSNVNVLGGDVRANTVVVQLDADGRVGLEALNVDHVVVDLVGYFTADGASTSTGGLFSFATPERLVDTRSSLGFGPLGARSPATLATGRSGSAIVQNVTVTETSAAGWLATYPAGATTPDISTVNFIAPDQTRAVLALTKTDAGSVSYESLVPTDVVVDIVGTFS